MSQEVGSFSEVTMHSFGKKRALGGGEREDFKRTNRAEKMENITRGGKTIPTALKKEGRGSWLPIKKIKSWGGNHAGTRGVKGGTATNRKESGRKCGKRVWVNSAKKNKAKKGLPRQKRGEKETKSLHLEGRKKAERGKRRGGPTISPPAHHMEGKAHESRKRTNGKRKKGLETGIRTRKGGARKLTNKCGSELTCSAWGGGGK